MKYCKMFFLLIVLFCSGCSYWPQAGQAEYYDQGAKEVKEDFDDIMGARTL